MKSILKVSIVFVLLMCFSCNNSVNETPVFHKSHEPKKQNAPFSDVVQVGNTLYLAGQIGMDHSVRKVVEGGIKAETKQTIENIKSVLEQQGSSIDNVVKCTVMLKLRLNA